MRAVPSRSRWFVPWRETEGARVRLLCLGHGGSGVARFKEWGELLPGDVDVVGVRLPGRESRRRETPLTSIEDVVAAVADELDAAGRWPVALAGLCFGALVMFELARELRRRGAPTPLHLVVVSQTAPSEIAPKPPGSPLLSEGPLDVALRTMGETPEEILDHPSLLALIEHAIRADLRASETYRYRPEEPLAVPITAIAALGDPTVSVEETEPWALETSAGFELRMLDGDHLFTGESSERLVGAVADALAQR